MLRRSINLLQTQLAELEAECQTRIAGGEEPAVANLDAATKALNELTQFLFARDIETRSLNFLLVDLFNLRIGAKPSPMLQPRLRRGRPPEPGIKDYLRGSLAAIAKSKQEMGSTRKEACEWVARHMPVRLTKTLGLRPKTIDDWLLKWGGDAGFEEGPGRDGYTDTRASLAGQQVGDVALQKGINRLAEFAIEGGAI